MVVSVFLFYFHACIDRIAIDPSHILMLFDIIELFI